MELQFGSFFLQDAVEFNKYKYLFLMHFSSEVAGKEFGFF